MIQEVYLLEYCCYDTHCEFLIHNNTPIILEIEMTMRKVSGLTHILPFDKSRHNHIRRILKLTPYKTSILRSFPLRDKFDDGDVIQITIRNRLIIVGNFNLKIGP